ncbi:E3 ubiquitin-protein ligase UPL4 isoform X2 [Andrographis paniculata]|uniref:E3 ubiquitin-protein ligase UPL4 isoform X2 n=1 Tax=Andrographis paniculata TaxID=175694 RepID=UPI0021E761BC|nr:E3 ubiquitin-protein ligase UPL4 isoform X2 [Andrographis paniculata]XP_051130280.1 E3 ubiquitin-protein ligase UPL4 isoform X2 [Andrographis paniculata]
MANRGQKRSDCVDGMPADKRACNSMEFRASASTSSAPIPENSVQEAQDAEMETSSSTSGSRSEGDVEKESAYGSCDSDYSIHDYYRQRAMGDHSKFKKLLVRLTEEAEESAQLALLTELCELLSFSSDGSLPSAMVDSFSPVLVRLARHETSPDIMLLSIRAITYMCDINPRAPGFLVRHDAVPALCKILMAIEYLDVAEQCLQALLRISQEQPLACLQAGAIMAILTYIDFFSTSIQRVALSAVVNICKKLSSDSPALFMEAVPTLCNLLQYEDKQVVESAATSLIRIGEQAYGSSNMLDEICKHGIVQHTIHLIGLNSRTTLCEPTYIGLIGLLAKSAHGSTVAFRSLFELDISSTVKDLLSTYTLTEGAQSTQVVEWQHSQIHEVLKLLNELLPEITAKQEGQQMPEKEAFLVENPDVLHKFGVDLLSILIEVVNSGVNLFICCGCLSVINKLIHLSTPDTLHSLLQTANLPSFLAGVFWRKDHHVISLVLQIVDNIMLKLPDVYINSFIKEGILFSIHGLLSPDKDLKLSPVLDGIRLENDVTQRSAARDVCRCPCFAFDTNQSSRSLENRVCKLEERTIQNSAKRIWAAYFEKESVNPEKGVTDVLQKLRTLSDTLTSMVNQSVEDATSGDREAEIYDLLNEIMSALNEKDSISSFEFVESGIIKAIVNYLSNGGHLLGQENIAPNQLRVMEKRFELFGRLLLSGANPARAECPLLILIQRLQSALSSVESFPVISNTSKRRNSYATVPYGHCTSYPCLKVQFLRGNEESGSDYMDDIVSVDPFVPVEEIEGYLWPRLCREKAKKLISESHASKGKDRSRSHSPLDSSIPQEKVVDAVTTAEMLLDAHELQEREVHSSPLAETWFASENVTDSSDATDIQTEEHDLSQCDHGANGDYQECSDSGDTSARLLFYLDGQQLNRGLSLYQSILKHKAQIEHGNANFSLWNHIYKITYRRHVTAKPTLAKDGDGASSSSLSYKRATSGWYTPVFSHMFGSKVGFEKMDPTHDILTLMRCLDEINRSRFHLVSREKTCAFAQGKTDDLDGLNVVACEVPQTEFVNKKLTEKLEQQMRVPMVVSVGAMPAWCTQLMAWCPFLFSFEARCKYFHLAALGQLQNQTNAASHSNSGGSNGRHHQNNTPRRKILVHRDKILESAVQMVQVSSRQSVEVEYNEEVGTGLGPTLEFYTLVCREFQKRNLCMWRDNSLSLNGTAVSEAEDLGLVSTVELFPRPWSPLLNTSSSPEYSEVIKRFTLLGQVVAKALQDGRVLDLPFSRAFYKLILEKVLTLYDIQSFDPAFGKALSEFQAVVERKEYLRSLCGSDNLDVCLRNTKIEDLCLDFTLPGYPDYALISEFDSKMVNLSNLDEYVALMVDAMTNSGIAKQVEAFKSGFDKVFPIRHLKVFTEEELERLLCGEHVLLNSDKLLDHIKFDHGYTISSPPIINLLAILKEFDPAKQRAFLQFVTGSPRLPAGGLASLNPKLTIVRKHCSNGIDVDLPSVMTCANYLKLPPYSSKDIMEEKLMYAITEGQGSFHLS